MLTRVKIIPKSNRAKNRVNEHGEIMLLMKEGSFEGERAICVKSVKETWGCAGRRSNWMGWIDTNEADWEILDGYSS